MKRSLFICFLMISVGIQAQKKGLIQFGTSRTIPFDNDWLFTKDSVEAAEQEGYKDFNWKTVDLPHDWSIEDLPATSSGKAGGPFDKKSIGGWATGYTVGGVGWYRKKFVMQQSDQNKVVTIYFDGIYMNSDVWLNGHHLGNHPYGYTPFYYDLTPYLKPVGEQNVLAVKVRNEGKNSRWYSGSGIYRHVDLTVTNAVHVIPWGVCITTPEITLKKATIHLKVSVYNNLIPQHNLTLLTTIITPDGKLVASAKYDFMIDPNASAIGEQSISLPNPSLWSVEKPLLYKAVTQIKDGNKILDKVETSFGIRSLSFTADNGFLLNGKKVLLKGGCIHHDNGPLGSAAINRAEERKIEILKKNGFNAIRTSHNPPSRQLLDACDRLGMLVVDEAFDMWEKSKNPNDYHLYFKEWWKKDLDAMILRDRNHPSVVIWSVGNEVPERVDSSGLRIVTQLAEEARRIDSTRPVTEALCEFWDHPDYKWDTTASVFALVDIAGYNYMFTQYESDHAKFPGRIIMGTESHPKAMLENWNMAEKHAYVIGDFVWSAFDYMGESSIGHASLDSSEKTKMLLGWPWNNAWCGDFDLTGNKKPQSYYRDVVWKNSPIAMAVHAPVPEDMVENVSAWGWPDEQQSWTWPGSEGKLLQVRVFSRSPEVRLLVNGKMIGRQRIGNNSITAAFQVPYQPGVLKAVNVDKGKETDGIEFKTTGAGSRIRLVADRRKIHANRNDLSYVSVEVVDKNGQLVPYADLPIQFSIRGPGKIAGVGNASPTEMASYQQPQRRTVKGKCLAIVRPTGVKGIVKLTATANGLKSASAEISME